jgi:glycosyltransferase involved in cell wall biosynthesis
VKKILFVINTLGRAGAEMALMEMLANIDRTGYEVSLFVLSGQGELIHDLPDHVRLLNETFDDTPVLSAEGTRRLVKNLIRSGLRSGALFYRLPYLIKNTFVMLRRKNFSLNKLMRRLLADGAARFSEEYDLAIAYLEGGAAFYVDEYVNAKKKAAFIHVDYNRAGYNRCLDNDTYLRFDRIFTVSDEVRTAFLQTYPECEDRTQIFHNMLNRKCILEKAAQAGGFSDGYDGFRILTVGRLYAQKALEVSIEAMKLLKESGIRARWYVLGEGEERKRLEKLIRRYHLEEDFLLLGATDNPYPYFAQTDLYVHASRFEGKSIAIQEAQILGCPIIVSDCSGNREQVIHEKDGLVCVLSPQGIRDAVLRLYRDTGLRERLGKEAAHRSQVSDNELKKIYEIGG